MASSIFMSDVLFFLAQEILALELGRLNEEFEKQKSTVQYFLMPIFNYN